MTTIHIAKGADQEAKFTTDALFQSWSRHTAGQSNRGLGVLTQYLDVAHYRVLCAARLLKDRRINYLPREQAMMSNFSNARIKRKRRKRRGWRGEQMEVKERQGKRGLCIKQSFS